MIILFYDDSIPYGLNHADDKGNDQIIFHGVNDDSIPYNHNHADGQGNNHIILHSDNHDTISYDMILTVSMLMLFL